MFGTVTASHTFTTPGTYFTALRVASQRDGDRTTPYRPDSEHRSRSGRLAMSRLIRSMPPWTDRARCRAGKRGERTEMPNDWPNTRGS
jgi:hypothetical protein